MVDDEADLNLNADKQPGRDDQTESRTEHSIDVSNEEVERERQKREEGKLTVDDIDDPELREHVKKAREEHGVTGEEPQPAEDHNPPGEEAYEDGGQQVRVSEGEDPLDAMAQKAEVDTEQETAAEPTAEPATEAQPDAADEEEEEEEGGSILDGVDDDDVEDAMDVDLNVREDIDPEHFNYEDQDFSVFGGYGQAVTIEYNEVYFRLVQPGDRRQEELINNMGGGLDDDGMALTDMMQALIDATVARPEDIESITSDWTPFERMGLGMQCMEFLGLDALGNT